MKVTALAGGVGGAKLLVGLERVLGSELTAIVNTGDDAHMYGLYVSPDIDIVTYWLAGIAETARGWGVAGDTFAVVDALGRLGEENWFRLGDRDLATCLYRTRRLSDGVSLSQVTAEICSALRVQARVLPMSDDRVRTLIETGEGRILEFQEYFVKEQARPTVRRVQFAGAAEAVPAPGVLEAIAAADRVVICPSNPLLSIAPILAIGDLRHAVARHRSVVAVTPIVGGKALKGPADRILAALGLSPSASGVASLYQDVCDTFVVDASDPEEIERVRALGIEPVALRTIMHDHDASEILAKELLSL